MSSRLNIATALAVFTLLPGSLQPKSFVTDHSRSERAAAEPDACSLLTESQVSAAIEAQSQPGQHGGKSSTKTCIWSDDPNHGIDHRRVTLSLTTLTGFQIGKSVPRTTAEPVAGLGDEAYYMIYQSHEAPTLVVRKGNSAFNVRLLNGLKAKGLSEAEVKARELALAKDAVGKL
jgi:hypothetical protein